MKLGLLTLNLAKDMDLKTIIDLSKEIGFEGVEFRVDKNQKHGVELERTKDERKRIKTLFESEGIEICGIGSGCRYDSLDPKMVKENVARTKSLLELTADLNGKGLKVFGNNFHDAEGIPRAKTVEQVATAVRECGIYAKNFGVELRFEMHGDFYDYRYALPVVERAEEANVTLIYNCDPRDKDIPDVLLRIMKHVTHVHMHDLTRKYPYIEMLRIFKRNGYKGYFVAEVDEPSSDPIRLMKYYAALWRAYMKLI